MSDAEFELMVCGTLAGHRVEATRQRYGTSKRVFEAEIFRILKLTDLFGEGLKIRRVPSLEEAFATLDVSLKDTDFWPPVEFLRQRKYAFYFHLNYLTARRELLRKFYPQPCTRAIQRANLIESIRRSSESDGIFRLSVNLRRYSGYASDRNSDLSVWREFILHAIDRGVRVVLIGPESGDLSDMCHGEVLSWTNHYDHDPILDLSAIFLCDAHIGSGSGFSIYQALLEGGLCFSVGADSIKHKENYGPSLNVSRQLGEFLIGPGIGYTTPLSDLQSLIEALDFSLNQFEQRNVGAHLRL